MKLHPEGEWAMGQSLPEGEAILSACLYCNTLYLMQNVENIS